MTLGPGDRYMAISDFSARCLPREGARESGLQAVDARLPNLPCSLALGGWPCRPPGRRAACEVLSSDPPNSAIFLFASFYCSPGQHSCPFSCPLTPPPTPPPAQPTSLRQLFQNLSGNQPVAVSLPPHFVYSKGFHLTRKTCFFT